MQNKLDYCVAQFNKNTPYPHGATILESPAGIRAWKNKTNGFTVIAIHFSADPAKRSVAWIEKMAEGMPGGYEGRIFAAEFNLCFSAFAGGLLYPEFILAFEGKPDTYKPTIMRSFDISYNNPAALWLQESEAGISIIGELLLHKVKTLDFLHACTEYENRLFGSGHIYENYSDVSAKHGEASSGYSAAKVMADAGIYPRMCKQNIIAGVNLVRSFMVEVNGQRLFTIDREACPILFKGITSTLVFEDNRSDKVENKVKKKVEKKDTNPASHLHDCLRYCVYIKYYHRIKDIIEAAKKDKEPDELPIRYWKPGDDEEVQT